MPLGPARRIILSRTDNIGDVVLTLPMVGLLKAQWPQTEIILLAREYVAPVARAFPPIDRFVAWDEMAQLDPADRVQALGRLEADAIVHVFPHRDVAAAARGARIPIRVGTSRRWWHLWTCSHRVRMTRRHSALHEAQLNVRLLEPWGLGAIPPLAALIPHGRLTPEPEAARRIGSVFDANRFSLVIHPGSKGNGREWPAGSYAQLLQLLPRNRVQVVVTGTAEERDRFIEVFATGRPIDDLTGRLDLAELIGLLAQADGVIASGTGPLHLAAALGRRTLGLFPSGEGVIGSGRWGPLGERTEVLTGRPACPRCPGPGDCACMRSVHVDHVVGVVERWLEG